MNVLSKYRVIDKHEREIERIAECKYFICDRPYPNEDIEYTSKYYSDTLGEIESVRLTEVSVL